MFRQHNSQFQRLEYWNWELCMLDAGVDNEPDSSLNTDNDGFQIKEWMPKGFYLPFYSIFSL